MQRRLRRIVFHSDNLYPNVGDCISEYVISEQRPGTVADAGTVAHVDRQISKTAIH